MNYRNERARTPMKSAIEVLRARFPGIPMPGNVSAQFIGTIENDVMIQIWSALINIFVLKALKTMAKR